MSTISFPGLNANCSTHFHQSIPVKEKFKKKKEKVLKKLKKKLGIKTPKSESEAKTPKAEGEVKSSKRSGEHYSISRAKREPFDPFISMYSGEKYIQEEGTKRCEHDGEKGRDQDA